MTKFLVDAGWQSHVLTVDQCDLPATLPIEIPEASISRAPQSFDLATVPRTIVGRKRLSVARVMPVQSRQLGMLWRLGEAYRHLICFPDAQIGWWRSAVKRGLAVARDFDPDVILSSSLPNTSHLVARTISRKTGVPWVAELRDLWTRNHNFRRVQPLRAIERRLERAVLGSADALVTVSDVWADELRGLYGRPTFVVPNGFDSADYPPPAEPSQVFSLVYTGMFYNGKQNPKPLFEAIARLAKNGRIRPERFKVRFVGQHLGPLVHQVRQFGIDSFVTVEPPVTYSDSLGLQTAATALLFLDWPDTRTKGWYSAKIYEYLGARRPILSVGSPCSVVGTLLMQTRAGIAAETADGVHKVLECWMRKYETDGKLRCDADPRAMFSFERRNAATRMADILTQYARR
jgi:glycosyltransferase involved in cell wall biosynthesis